MKMSFWFFLLWTVAIHLWGFGCGWISHVEAMEKKAQAEKGWHP